MAIVIKTNFVGIEPEDVPPHDPTQGLIWAYAVQILYNPILALVKSSILIFLIRLFGQRKWVRRFLVWLNVINISQMVGVFFAILLQCTPISLNWDPTVSGGYCVDRRILYISTSAFNIVTDVLILGLPLWIFSSLKIPKRAKTALLIIFLLGFLCVDFSHVPSISAAADALVYLMQRNHHLHRSPDTSCPRPLQHPHLPQLSIQRRLRLISH